MESSKTGHCETRAFLVLLHLAGFLALAGCGSNWQAAVVAPDGSLYPVDGHTLQTLGNLAEEEPGIPLERVLWIAGHGAVERIIVTGPEGERQAEDEQCSDNTEYHARCVSHPALQGSSETVRRHCSSEM